MSFDGVNGERRRFLTAAVTVVGGIGVAFTAVPFITYWEPSARAKAIGAPVEVDIKKLEPGQMMTVKWRGKPIWILRRTKKLLAAIRSLDSVVRDPDSKVTTQQPDYARNEYRSIEPEYLVVIGICTHLGCSPKHVTAEAAAAGAYNLGSTWKGGFFCPCHGSKFDLAGRVFPGVPAPTNLVVPPYRYLTDARIEIGVDQGKKESAA